MFDDVKKYNKWLENIEYSEDAYSLYNHYHMEPSFIEDAWIDEHITTDLETIYNNDGSITFRSSDYTAEENVDGDINETDDTNEDEIKSNMVVPIIVLASVVLVGGASLILKRK